MPRRILLLCLLIGSLLLADSASAAGPPEFFKRSPFTAELEVYSGGISGDSIGAAYQSATRGDYGVRFTFGFLKALNFNLDYMYSNQSRSFAAVSPETATLPHGSLVMRANNLNVFFGSGEFNLIQTEKAKFYISPGVGVARNGSRDLTLITPLGGASVPLVGGRAVTFNLGAGVKVYPRKRLGLRFDVRDHISQGGTGSLNPDLDLDISGNTLPNPQQYFGRIPVQNNLVFTVGLIFRLL